MVTVASFYVRRPEDYPKAPDYIPLLKVLQASCDKFGHRHVVLSDEQVPGFETHVAPLPRALMPAIHFAQRDWVANGNWKGVTVLVGADCLVNKSLSRAMQSGVDMIVTSRAHRKWPINTGAIFVREEARLAVALLQARVAEKTGPEWGDDQVQLAAALAPMPPVHCITGRAGLNVQFAPLSTHNDTPKSVDHPSSAYVVHFKGPRKHMMAPWAAKHLGIAA